MRVRYILRTIEQIRYLRLTIRRYGDSLKKGKYFMFNGYRALSNDSSESLNRAKVYFEKTKKLTKIDVLAMKINNTRYFYNSNKNSSEEYDAVYTANNFDKTREIKLFSFSENKILTICTNENERKKQIEQYENFGTAYNMPRVTPKDKYSNSYEIAMVDLLPVPDVILAFEEIADSIIRFNFDSNKFEKASVEKLIELDCYDEMNSLLGDLVSKIDESLLQTEIPVCIQHGDLSKDNLIYGLSENKESFWWIDWEHASKRVFFYDYFFYVLNSTMYSDETTYQSYMSQECDLVLEKFFNHFGLKFDADRKKDYFLIFAIVFLKERVCDSVKINALKKYISLINEKFI